MAYFTLTTGGFFGLTIDVTKLPHPGLIQYVYAVICFIAGYSVRHVIQILSNIANSIFMVETPEDKKKKKKEMEKEVESEEEKEVESEETKGTTTK